jgi:hypothetical protein
MNEDRQLLGPHSVSILKERAAGSSAPACSPPHFGGSAFLSHVHHAFAQTDGTYAWPNSREGDMLRQAKREIERLMANAQPHVQTGREAGGL